LLAHLPIGRNCPEYYRHLRWALADDALLGLVTCRAPGTAERLVGLWSNGEPPLPVRSRAVTLAVLDFEH
jgi:hypothetical protein